MIRGRQDGMRLHHCTCHDGMPARARGRARVVA
jgi:hypothetical protein